MFSLSKHPAALVVIASCAFIQPVSAETGSSSWVQRTIPQRPAIQAPITGSERRRVKGLRSNVDAAKAVQKKKSLGKTLIPPTGDNAAYIAFDQGQYITALKLAEKQAQKSDPQAHTLLGRLYAEGLGVPKNEFTAAKWYRRGAELGDVEAMFAFGVILASGTAVKQNHDGAAQMFERAARKGHAYAHYNLALQFLSGKGKPENPFRASQHLEFAARKGIAEAQYDLAALYQKGHGVKADAYKAALWLRQAADRDMAAAQYEYATVLLKGLGLNQDRPKTMALLHSAATKGIAGAQNRLAHVYSVGIPGVKKSAIDAAKWRYIAKSNGVADPGLDKVIASYPRKVRLEAQKAAQLISDRRRAGLQ